MEASVFFQDLDLSSVETGLSGGEPIAGLGALVSTLLVVLQVQKLESKPRGQQAEAGLLQGIPNASMRLVTLQGTSFLAIPCHISILYARWLGGAGGEIWTSPLNDLVPCAGEGESCLQRLPDPERGSLGH